MPVAAKKTSLPGDEIVGRQDAVEVVAGGDRLGPLLVVGGDEPRLDGAAEALDGAGGDDALGRSADPEQHVDPGARRAAVTAPPTSPARMNRTLAPAARTSSTRPAWRGRSRTTTVRSLIGRLVAAAIRRRFSATGTAMSIDLGRVGADGDLVHVATRTGVEHRTPLGQRGGRQGPVHAPGGQAAAVDRVDGDVDGRSFPPTHVLAGEEDRDPVLVALADDHDPVHRDGVHQQAHRPDGRLLGDVLLPPAHQAGRGQGRRLRDPHQLQPQVAVRGGSDRGEGHRAGVAPEPRQTEIVVVHRLPPYRPAPAGTGVSSLASDPTKALASPKSIRVLSR